MKKLSRSRQKALSGIAFAAGLIVCLCGNAHADSGREGERATPNLSEVYLIQNSGWMEPFYADQGSQFRSVVTSLIGATQLVGVATIVATFNQDGQIPGHSSPERVFAGSGSIQSCDGRRRYSAAPKARWKVRGLEFLRSPEWHDHQALGWPSRHYLDDH